MDSWGFVLIPRVRHRLRSTVDYLFGDGYLKVTDLYELRDVPEVGDERLLIATREGFYFDIFNDRVKIVGRSDGITQCSKIHYSRFGHVLCGSDQESRSTGASGLSVIPQVCSLESTTPGVISWDCRRIVNELAEKVISGGARLQLLRATSANGRYEVVDEVSGDPMSLTNIYTEDKYLNGGSFFYKARYLARRDFPSRGIRKLSYESSDILDVEPAPLAS